MEDNQKVTKGWVFISHSHQDVDKVRILRNRLEELDYEPLMFYLKCLSDNDEIEDLIKREIDARNIFIYADSENARKSKWVKTERDYIAQKGKKMTYTIDLEGDIDRHLSKFSRLTNVFISYSHKDIAIAKLIKDIFNKKDMVVNYDIGIECDFDFFETIKGKIIECCKKGFIIALISQECIGNYAVECEIETAINAGGMVIPIWIGNIKFDKNTVSIWETLSRLKGINISEQPTRQELEKVYEIIEEYFIANR